MIDPWTGRVLLRHVLDDGGRADAGYKGDTRDCVTRAIAIATGRSYKQVYTEMSNLASLYYDQHPTLRRHSPRNGVLDKIWVPYIEAQGWRYVEFYRKGQRARAHAHLDGTSVPMEGTFIVRVSGHVVTVIDGELRDTYDSSRYGERVLYGYYVHD